MVRSMTGFGRAEASGESIAVTVEARSVNHRHLDVALRLPRALAALELDARRLVQSRLERGRVEVTVQLTPLGGATTQRVQVAGALAGESIARARALAMELGLEGTPNLTWVLDRPGVVRLEEPEPVEPAAPWPLLAEALGRALDELVGRRTAEGERLLVAPGLLPPGLAKTGGGGGTPGAAAAARLGRRGTLFVVSAPSGAGKTTLCREARLCIPDLAYSVSATTRAPRPGEVNGVDFRFVSEREFRTMLERGELAEWATVHGNMYGTPARPLEAALADGKDVLLDIDTQGAAQLRTRYPEAVLVFIVAPSMAELEQRLRERGADAEGDIARRLARAREEIALWRTYGYFIVNRDVKEAMDQLLAVIQAERCRTARLSLTLPDLEVSE